MQEQQRSLLPIPQRILQFSTTALLPQSPRLAFPSHQRPPQAKSRQSVDHAKAKQQTARPNNSPLIIHGATIPQNFQSLLRPKRPAAQRTIANCGHQREKPRLSHSKKFPTTQKQTLQQERTGQALFRPRKKRVGHTPLEKIKMPAAERAFPGRAGGGFKGIDDDVVHEICGAVREDAEEAVRAVIEYNLTII